MNKAKLSMVESPVSRSPMSVHSPSRRRRDKPTDTNQSYQNQRQHADTSASHEAVLLSKSKSKSKSNPVARPRSIIVLYILLLFSWSLNIYFSIPYSSQLVNQVYWHVKSYYQVQNLHLKKRIAIIESIGGSDKGFDGWRRDTRALLQAIKDQGWSAKVFKFYDGKEEELFDTISSYADAYISRVDPGEYVNFTPSRYFAFLERLQRDAEMVGFPKNQEMIEFGSKKTIVKLNGLPFSLEDTMLYEDKQTFRLMFPITLQRGRRVLKRSGGALGAGIWLVDAAFNQCFDTTPNGTMIHLDGTSMVVASEALRNRKLTLSLDHFMEMCEHEYLSHPDDFIIDMKYLHGIRKGEVRVLFIGSEPKRVVHRVPAEFSFSAGLESGATHNIHSVNDPPFKAVVQEFQSIMPLIQERLNMSEFPLLWTADFIIDEDHENGMVLSEINSNCIGFSAHRDFATLLATEAIHRIIAKKKSLVLNAWSAEKEAVAKDGREEL